MKSPKYISLKVNTCISGFVYQWWHVGRRFTKSALSMSTRQMAHVASTPAGSVAAANTLENLVVGADSRRAASACAAAACASAAVVARDASVAAHNSSPDSSKFSAGVLRSKIPQMINVAAPAQMNIIRR